MLPFKITSICKGGGYSYCRTEPRHPNANSKGLYPLHRVLVENRIGRLLLGGEVVHHVDCDKTNNADSNLELLTRASHSQLHTLESSVTCKCVICGLSFELKPAAKRLRENRNRSGGLTCSRSCGAKLGAVQKNRIVAT